jgi:hypothetical protein
MVSRSFSIRTALLPTLGAAFVLGSMVVALSAESRVRLGADVLDRSRGTNPNLVLTQASCNALQGNAACQQVGAACTSCSRINYALVIGGANGGYNPGVAGGGTCGTQFSGVCQANLTCSQAINLGACNKPPGLPAVQP